MRYMTSLGLVNFLFFQWFFVRLVFCYDADTEEYVGWLFLKGIIPSTGWYTRYRYLPGCKPKPPEEIPALVDLPPLLPPEPPSVRHRPRTHPGRRSEIISRARCAAVRAEIEEYAQTGVLGGLDAYYTRVDDSWPGIDTYHESLKDDEGYVRLPDH